MGFKEVSASLVVLLLLLPVHVPAAEPKDSSTYEPLDVDYSDVLLVRNSNSQMSMNISAYFAQKRGIPSVNICTIDVPARETINRTEFQRLRTQVESCLLSHGLKDRINYIVTTKGVPLRVSGTSSSRASVDAELTMVLGKYNYSIGNSGTVTNPYFGSTEEFNSSEVGIYLVTRLTAYNYSEVLNIIDLAANSTGKRGLFVLDVDSSKGAGYQAGNTWMYQAAQVLQSKGYQVLLDNTTTYVTHQTNVSGYTSWGSNDCCDTDHAKPHNTWVPGAIGETYVSTGGRTFTYPPTYGQSLIADWVHEGITGISGHVYEPYLTACIRPQILFDSYTGGLTLAESFYSAMPFIGWQEVVVGDPKTAPYSDVPDLRVLEINTTSRHPVEGTGTEMVFVIENHGGSQITGTLRTYLGFQGGTPLVPPMDITLDPWEVLRVYVNHTFENRGSYWVSAVLETTQQERFSSNNDAAYQLTVYGKPEVSLELADLPDELWQGEPLQGRAVLRNTGETNYTYVLNVTSSSGESNSTQGTLPAGGEMETEFTLDTSGYAGTMNITAHAAGSYCITAEASASVFVRYSNITSSSITSGSTVPGSTYTASFNITNNGNVPEDVRITADSTWGVALSEDTVSLKPGDSASISVTVTVPYYTPAGTSEYVNLTLIPEHSPEIVRSFTVTALRVSSLLLSTETDSMEFLPGESRTLTILADNQGNAEEVVQLDASLPEGWSYTSPENISVPAWDYAYINLTVTCPANATPDHGGELILDGITVMLTVSEVHNLSADVPSEVEAVWPGGVLNVALHNMGNVPESITVTCRGAPCTAEPREVAPWGSTEISVSLNTSTLTPGEHTLKVTVHSYTDLSYDVLVTVLRPVISWEITWNSTSQSFNVTVRNTGTASGTATLVLSIDGTAVNTTTLSVPPEAERTYTVNATLDPGTHTAVLEGPGGSEKITVLIPEDEEPSREQHASGIPWYAWVVIPLAVLIYLGIKLPYLARSLRRGSFK